MARQGGLLGDFWSGYNQRRAASGRPLSSSESRGLMSAVLDQQQRDAELGMQRSLEQQRIDAANRIQEKAAQGQKVAGAANLLGSGFNTYLGFKGLETANTTAAANARVADAIAGNLARQTPGVSPVGPYADTYSLPGQTPGGYLTPQTSPNAANAGISPQAGAVGGGTGGAAAMGLPELTTGGAVESLGGAPGFIPVSTPGAAAPAAAGGTSALSAAGPIGVGAGLYSLQQGGLNAIGANQEVRDIVNAQGAGALGTGVESALGGGDLGRAAKYIIAPQTLFADAFNSIGDLF